LYAQRDPVPVYGTNTLKAGLKKNVVYGSVGGYVFWGAANGNYERLILERKDDFFKTYLIKVGIGGFFTYELAMNTFVTSLTALTGSKNRHLELSIGTAILFGSYKLNDPYNPISLTPAGALGYRFQSPKKHFVFRMGVGFPEVIYLSLGFSF